MHEQSYMMTTEPTASLREENRVQNIFLDAVSLPPTMMSVSAPHFIHRKEKKHTTMCHSVDTKLRLICSKYSQVHVFTSDTW